jgi:hypothetical protein
VRLPVKIAINGCEASDERDGLRRDGGGQALPIGEKQHDDAIVGDEFHAAAPHVFDRPIRHDVPLQVFARPNDESLSRVDKHDIYATGAGDVQMGPKDWRGVRSAARHRDHPGLTAINQDAVHAQNAAWKPIDRWR